VIHDLDSEAAYDPVRVGAKAAWLGRARRAGLPVLPGLVVDAAASIGHMSIGREKLAVRGSGGARLAMTDEPPPFADELIAGAGRLGDVLVARSSTALEASGEWSGAFTSYLDVSPGDIPRAVSGCWASAFSVAALERQKAAGVEPGSFSMAVLVQPALSPEAGGVARVDDHGTVVVTGVKGPPAPLLQGWSTGHEARRTGKGWAGDTLVELVGVEVLDELAEALLRAQTELGPNNCEWALDGRVWILQLGRADDTRQDLIEASPVDPRLVRSARMVARHEGEVQATTNQDPGRRLGVGPWEPFVASVVLGNGVRHQGIPSSPGIGAGILIRRGDTNAGPIQPRRVLAAGQPVPNLAPLLWDAAGLVTETGSAAAHLFESARALHVPAVCGVAIPPGDWIVAVDGYAGVVATIPLRGDTTTGDRHG
jgi:phosphoenolpyruvate synthase/pyruvate phosphate dikinase